MKGILKLLGWLIGIVVVAVIAAIIIIPQVFDPNQYKDKITEVVRDKTGRDLIIDGDLKLSVFPAIAIKTGRLTFSNPPEFGDKAMAEIDGANIDVSLMPLLSKKVEAGEVKLLNPVIRLITLEDGRTNWEDLAGSGEPESSEPESTASGDAAIAALAIQGVSIENGSVLWDDRKSPAKYTVTNLGLRTGAIIPGRAIPVEIEADVVGDGLPEALAINADLNATAETTLNNIQLDAVNLTVKGQTIDTAISIPSALYDMEASRFTAATIDGTAKIGENDISLNIPGVNLDLASGIIESAGLQASAKAGDAIANIAANSLNLDLNQSQITLGAITGDAVSGDMSARLSVPQISTSLSAKQFRLKNIGVDAKINDLVARVDVPDVSIDTELMAVSARGVVLKAEGLQAVADINANDLDKTPRFDGRAVLKDADLRAAAKKAGGFVATDPNALSRVDLDVTFNGTPDHIIIPALKGRLDDTALAGTADINLGDQSYKISLAGGNLILDRYMPAASESAGTQVQASNDAAAATAGAPVALGSLNINSDIRMQQLKLESAGIIIDDLFVRSAATKGSSQVPVEFKGRLSGETLPEPAQLDASASVDLRDTNSIKLSNVEVKVDGETLKGVVSTPSLTVPGSGPINLNDLTASLRYTDIEADLKIPSFSIDTATNALSVKDVTGRGKYAQYASDLAIGQLTGNLSRNAFAVTGLAANIQAKGPLGKITADALKVDLTSETLTTEGLVFVGDAGRVDLVVNATDIIKDPKLDGSIKSQGLNGRKLLELADIDFKPADATALTAIDIDAGIKGSFSAFSLEPFALGLDGTPIQGALRVQQKPTASYTYNVSVGDLNLDKYMPATAAGAGAPAAEQNAAAAVAAPAALLKDLRVNGDLKIASLTTGGMKVSNIVVGTRSKDGVVTMSPIQANLYGGAASGKIVVDARNPDRPTIKVDQSLQGLQLGPALASAGVSEKLEGTGNLTANLSAVGLDDASLRRSLNGTVAFNLADGAIKGFDIRKILVSARRLYEQAKGRQPTVDSAENDKTRFSEMSGTLVMNGGNATNDDLVINAPLFRITGKGGASLVDQVVDYGLTVNVVDSIDGQGGAELATLKNVPVPVRISGPFEDPKFRVDLASLVKNTAKKKAKEKIQEKLNEKLGLPTTSTGSDGGTSAPTTTKGLLTNALQKKLDKKYGTNTQQIDQNTQPAPAPAPEPQPTAPAPVPEQQPAAVEQPPEDPKEALKKELKDKLFKKLFN